MSEGRILNIKRFEIHDGPGLRTTLFLKGCPLRCIWCHNPESQRSVPELGYYAHKCIACGSCVAVCPTGAHRIADGVHAYIREACIHCGTCSAVCPKQAIILFGKTVTPEEILPFLLEDKVFFNESQGGVTVSGGEPLAQPDFTAELLTLLHQNNIHTAVDTCLYASRTALDHVLQNADLFLIDIKALDDTVHRTCTGVSNRLILENLEYLDRLGVPYEIRIPMIPSKNDEEIYGITAYLKTLKNVNRVKLLAYHDLSRTKYNALGMEYGMGDITPPKNDTYEKAFAILCDAGLNAIHK